MKNQYYTGTPTSRRFALCPTTILAGDPVLIGDEPAVAMNDYSSATGGAVFMTGGSFILTVVAVTQISPAVGAAMKPGDQVYATGTLDSTTNITHSLTLSGTTGDTPFGFIDPSYTGGIASGVTDTAAVVRLQGAE